MKKCSIQKKNTAMKVGRTILLGKDDCYGEFSDKLGHSHLHSNTHQPPPVHERSKVSSTTKIHEKGCYRQVRPRSHHWKNNGRLVVLILELVGCFEQQYNVSLEHVSCSSALYHVYLHLNPKLTWPILPQKVTNKQYLHNLTVHAVWDTLCLLHVLWV